MSLHGRFITVEGIDGAGKSTQLDALADWLRGQGRDLLVTREPGGTAAGEAIRELVLHRPMGGPAETLLMFAARAEHVERVIGPALAAGQWVLCDRFTDATYAYQCGGRGLPPAAVATLEQWVHPHLQPDLTVLFDVRPEIAAARLAAARRSDRTEADRFEAERVEFFGRVRAVYLERAARFAHRFVVVEADAHADEVTRRLLAVCADRLQ
jgi:dTMP kinase